MAGALLADEVETSISSGIGQALENKEQKGKGEQYSQQPQYRAKQKEMGSPAKFSHYYSLINFKRLNNILVQCTCCSPVRKSDEANTEISLIILASHGPLSAMLCFGTDFQNYAVTAGAKLLLQFMSSGGAFMHLCASVGFWVIPNLKWKYIFPFLSFFNFSVINYLCNSIIKVTEAFGIKIVQKTLKNDPLQKIYPEPP